MLQKRFPWVPWALGGGGGTWGYHYDEPRSLTNRERARLFGFPDDIKFFGNFTEIRRQIGNAVPPIGIKPFIQKLIELVSSENRNEIVSKQDN